MMLKTKEISYKTMLFVSGIIGVAAFLLIYGYKVLNITNDGWLVNGAGDTSAHYVGWLYYRDAPWQFPIGLQEGITYPYKFSVVYMDSIPIFALLFKILSPFLPGTFQYFGLYGLFTYVLQAVLGCRLVYDLTKDAKAGILGSVFFTMSSTMIQRMFAHSALAFHPIILFAMICYFNREKIIEKKRDVIYWSFILVLACSVQAYFVPMVFAFMAAFYLPEILCRKWYKGCIKIAFPTAVTVFVMYVWGYFYGSHELNGGGLGSYNSNINALLNDLGNSLFASLMGKIKTAGIWEAYAYLGAGVIILGGIALYDMIRNKKYTELNMQHIIIMLLIAVFLFVSIYPTVRFGKYTLLELPLPDKIAELAGTFRSNGRFMWPVMYMIMLGVIVYVVRNFKNSAYLILIIFLLIQILDLLPACKAQNNRISLMVDYESKLSASVWNELNKQEIFFFYEPVGAPMDITAAMGKYANDHNMVMNDFYTSRKDTTQIQQNKILERDKILSGNPDKNKLYVFNEIPLEFFVNETNLHFYTIDGISIGITQKLSGQKEVSVDRGIDLIKYSSAVVTEGEKDETGAHIYQAGELNTDTLLLPAGTYQMVLTGDNLDNVLLSVAEEGAAIEMDKVVHLDEQISVQFTLEKAYTDIAVSCQNSGTGEALLTGLILSKDLNE